MTVRDLETLTIALSKLTLPEPAPPAAGGASLPVIPDPAAAARLLMELIEQEEQATAPAAVVMAHPELCGGWTLRWYRDAAAAGAGPRLSVLAAGRRGVLFNPDVFLASIPAAWIRDAERAAHLMQDGADADALAMATHRRTRLFAGDVVEVTR